MQIFRTLAELRQQLNTGHPRAIVPTMGNLHEGHLSLIRQAKAQTEHVTATIFVNRLQFAPGEDFDQYPRTFAADCEKLESVGVSHLFAPDEQEMYPSPQGYRLQPDPVHTAALEGEFRPDHFAGVATVVLKLFNMVQPEIAIFGKKDYQQLMIIRNMVNQLALPIAVQGGETVRATDGLALSSRNQYLSDIERQQAPQLYQQLRYCADAIRAQQHDFDALEHRAIDTLRAQGWQPDYIAIRRQSDLQRPSDVSQPLVIVAAARLGKTRLIDNLEV